MIQPRFVTFTGLDARTDLDRVLALSRNYPIEWGILHGGKPGKNRYPEVEVRRRFEAHPLRLAAHLCGDIARSFMHGGRVPGLEAYGRIQVNARTYDMFSLFAVRLRTAQRIILQHRDGPFPSEPAFDFLLDRSGGRGVAEVNFPPAPNGASTPQLVGYAGGIGPETVRDIMGKIKAHEYWLDMETCIRDDDDWLDLDKCAAVCQEIWGNGLYTN